MPISYPIDHPSTPGFSWSRFTPRAVVGVSTSPFTLAQQVYQHQGQGFQFEAKLPPMRRADAEPWLAFFLKLNGMRGTFRFGDPDAKTPRGVATGTPLVKGNGQSGNSLITDGWTPTITGILKAGDYLQLEDRIYKVLDDANSNGTGEATLTIWPNLRSVPSDDSPLIKTNAKGLFRLSSNEMPWEADEISVYGITFAGIEAL